MSWTFVTRIACSLAENTFESAWSRLNNRFSPANIFIPQLAGKGGGYSTVRSRNFRSLAFWLEATVAAPSMDDVNRLFATVRSPKSQRSSDCEMGAFVFRCRFRRSTCVCWWGQIRNACHSIELYRTHHQNHIGTRHFGDAKLLLILWLVANWHLSLVSPFPIFFHYRIFLSFLGLQEYRIYII